MALKDIILYKHAWLKAHEQEILGYKKNLRKKSLPRSLKDALSKNKPHFICEIKPSSPSMGVIRTHADVLAIAKTYAQFASAISVLADEKYFGGSLQNVSLVSEHSSLPVICKDIIVSPLQVIAACHFGADAVLLMLSVLDDQSYVQCASMAQKLGLDVICEVHEESELARALTLGASIIGINNRNLKDLSVDLALTKKLLPKILAKEVIIISESGFEHYHQWQELYKKGVNGFLVGTSLMKKERIDLALREFIFGRVKICGLTNGVDAKLAYDQGAYYGGLNFAKQSKRVLSIEQSLSILTAAPLIFGGVFVNQDLLEVSNIANHLALSFVQLHGDEDEDYIKALRRNLNHNCRIWQALRISNSLPTSLSKFADMTVFDTHTAHAYGGSGQCFDWSLLEGYAYKNQIMLAGGINLSNIKKAASLGVFAIDIASGVEEEQNPRQKSAIKMTKIFNELRS